MKRLINVFIIMTILLLLAVGCNSEVSTETLKKESDYLVLLYLSGDSNNGNNFFPTLQQAEDALYEIRNDDGSAKSGYATVNVVALWDGSNELNESVHSDSKTRLLELGPGFHDINDNTNDGQYSYYSKVDWSLSSNTKDLSSTVSWITKNGRQEVNMGSQEILTQFLSWTRSHYNAENIILLFGDHGSGPHPEEEKNSKALMFDDDPNNDSDSAYITTSKIRNALDASGYCGKEKIDLIIEDLCLQASIDEAYGLKGYADYLLASEEVTMGNSLGCYNLIKKMRKNTPVLTIAKNQVSYYKDKWAKYEDKCFLTFSLIDLSQVDVYERIKTNTNKLAQEINQLGENKLSEIVKNLRSSDSDGFDYGYLINASYIAARDFGLLVEQLGKKYPALETITTAIQIDLKKIILMSYANGISYTQKYKFDYPLKENQIYGLTIAVDNNHRKKKLYDSWTQFSKDNKWSILIVDKVIE